MINYPWSSARSPGCLSISSRLQLCNLFVMHPFEKLFCSWWVLKRDTRRSPTHHAGTQSPPPANVLSSCFLWKSLERGCMEKGVEPAGWRAEGGFFSTSVCLKETGWFFSASYSILKYADYRMQWQAATFSNERRPIKTVFILVVAHQTSHKHYSFFYTISGVGGGCWWKGA